MRLCWGYSTCLPHEKTSHDLERDKSARLSNILYTEGAPVHANIKGQSKLIVQHMVKHVAETTQLRASTSDTPEPGIGDHPGDTLERYLVYRVKQTCAISVDL